MPPFPLLGKELHEANGLEKSHCPQNEKQNDIDHLLDSSWLRHIFGCLLQFVVENDIANRATKLGNILQVAINLAIDYPIVL